MNRLILICLCSLVAVSADLMSLPMKNGLSTQEKLFLSKFDEDFLEETDPEEWVFLVKQMGKDKIAVQFPSQPHLAYDKKKESSLFSSSEEGIRYALEIENPRHPEDREAFFQGLIEEAKRSPYELLETVSGAGPYGSYLDIVYLERDAMVHKKRVLMHSDHTYTLTTSKKLSLAKDKHEFFIASFEIIRPLS